MLDAARLIRDAEALDPVPATVGQLVTIISRDHWAFSEVEQVIGLDQALTGRLLQIANSAASATLIQVGTVKDAIIRVGVGPVVSFATAASIGPAFRRALPAYGLGEDALWRHSVAASLAAEVVMAMAQTPVPAETVTAALLHDVGKIILARYMTPAVLRQLVDTQATPGFTPTAAEAAVLGLDHAALGSLIARRWELPERLAQAIAYHHTPDAIADPLCDAVHVADLVAHAVIGTRNDVAAEDTEPAPEAAERLGLGDTFLPRLCCHVGRRLDEVMARYAVAVSPHAAA